MDTELSRGAGMTPELENLLRDEIRLLSDQKDYMTHEIEQHKEKNRELKALLQWAYNQSREALMVSAQKPRAARKAREQAICDINKRLGAYYR